eukprot:GHVL01027866.1.p1 GENE.GHVL01027866.1~~GHVL01027866.1.p1  ORF type:complete len:428 (-),score=99.45 GHVL01027866.1:476-1759(-)
MSESDEDFEFESDEEGSDSDILVENTFYEADDEKLTNPIKSIELLYKVIDIEKNKKICVWSYKSYLNIVLLFSKLKKKEEMEEAYSKLLDMSENVTPNEVSEAVNSILDEESSLYEMTLYRVKHNKRLWFSVAIRLAKIYLYNKDIIKLKSIIDDLNNESVDLEAPSRATLFLEMYCIEMEYYSIFEDTNRIRDIYLKTLKVSSAVADLSSLGIIRECYGKMCMTERRWGDAYNEFFEAFKNFQECGNTTRAKQLLQYVLLANMLAVSNINPFDSREAKVFENDPEIECLARIRHSLDNENILNIGKIIKNSKIETDDYMKTFLPVLLNNIWCECLKSIVRPYTCVKIDYLADEIHITRELVTKLLEKLILDGGIEGKVDDVQGVLELDCVSIQDTKIETAHKLLSALTTVSDSVKTNVFNSTVLSS